MQVDPRRPFPRRFVPTGATMGEWAQIEPLFTRLRDRSINSADELERWLVDCSELSAAIAEERTRRYIAMTVQTDDPVREAAYQEFIEQIDPKTKSYWHALELAYLENPHRRGLPADRYGVLDRIVENNVSLFREENIPLETQDALLMKDYQKLTGAMTIVYRGEEMTLQQAAKFLEEPDRSLRQQVWELLTARRLRDKDALEDLFDRMVALRTQIARNAGFGNSATTPSSGAGGLTTRPRTACSSMRAWSAPRFPWSGPFSKNAAGSWAWTRSGRGIPWSTPGAAPRYGPLPASTTWLRASKRSSAGSIPPWVISSASCGRSDSWIWTAVRARPREATRAPCTSGAGHSSSPTPSAATTTCAPCSTKAATPSTSWPRASNSSSTTATRPSNLRRWPRWAWSCSPRRTWTCSTKTRMTTNARSAPRWKMP